MLDLPFLFINTLLLRPYVFVFLGFSLLVGHRLLGWKRTGVFLGITWLTAFASEFSSTRIGIPFGAYFYTGSTHDQELYISNIPFMDSLSFSFLLLASYCLALWFISPWKTSEISHRDGLDTQYATSWRTVFLTSLFFMFIDIVIDPVALRGDRWFLGLIYGYPEPGIYFGVPLANFAGWIFIGLVSMTAFRTFEKRHNTPSGFQELFEPGTILLGCGLYYGVLFFNLSITFWIGEPLIGTVGCFIFLPITVLAYLKFLAREGNHNLHTSYPGN